MEPNRHGVDQAIRGGTCPVYGLEFRLRASRFMVAFAGFIGIMSVVAGIVTDSLLGMTAGIGLVVGIGLLGVEIRWEALDRSDRGFL